MSELEPCPFCGGEARFKVWGNVVGVECDRCGIGTHTACIDEYQNAIDAWNTRAERTCRPIEMICETLPGTECPAWKCSECGELFEEGARYCSQCGAKVVGHD